MSDFAGPDLCQLCGEQVDATSADVVRLVEIDEFKLGNQDMAIEGISALFHRSCAQRVGPTWRRREDS